MPLGLMEALFPSNPRIIPAYRPSDVGVTIAVTIYGHVPRYGRLPGSRSFKRGFISHRSSESLNRR